VPDAQVSDEQRLRQNDIAICMSSGSPEVVGNTARVPYNLRASIGSFCGIIRPKSPDEASYLSFFFRSAAFRKHRNAIARGANIQNLRFSQFEEIELEIPSEQQRIAQRLDQADRLRRTRRYGLELTDTFHAAAFLELSVIRCRTRAAGQSMSWKNWQRSSAANSHRDRATIQATTAGDSHSSKLAISAGRTPPGWASSRTALFSS